MLRSVRPAPPRPVRRAAALAVLAGAIVAVGLGVGVGPASAANGEPFAASQWGLRQVGAEAAWDVTKGRGARIGIIDTGVDFGHSEMAGRVLASIRCIGTGGQAARCGGSAQDDSGHGTHVAGIIGAPLDGVGVAGVAPEASLLVVKALGSDGSGEAIDVAAGIDWLLAQGANVVNLSLAETLSPGRVQGSPLEAAIRRAADAGAVVVLAAGNHGEAVDGSTAFNLPAIVVGATNKSGGLARYSKPLTSGVRWGMVAPGGDGAGGADGEVVSTYWFAGRHNSYAWSEGTSMSTPHVAGVAGLLAAQGVRGQAAVDRLLGTAAPADCGTGCRGRLDARAAVGAPGGASAPAPAQAASNGAAVGAGAIAAAVPVVPGATSPESRPGGAVGAPLPTPPSGPTSFDPAAAQVAIAPVGRPVALEVPEAPTRPGLAPWLVAVAGAALLAVAGVTAWCGRGRRPRADEGW